MTETPQGTEPANAEAPELVTANDVIAAGTASPRKRTRNLAARIGADLDRLLEQVQAEQRIATLEDELRAAKASLNQPGRSIEHQGDPDA